MAASRRARHVRWYLGLYIFAVLMAASTVGWWHQTYAQTRSESAQLCEVVQAIRPDAACPRWKTADQRTEFWAGLWENDRSEYEQLFMQTLVNVVLASLVMLAAEAAVRRIEAKVDFLVEAHGGDPADLVPALLVECGGLRRGC